MAPVPLEVHLRVSDFVPVPDEGDTVTQEALPVVLERVALQVVVLLGAVNVMVPVPALLFTVADGTGKLNVPVLPAA